MHCGICSEGEEIKVAMHIAYVTLRKAVELAEEGAKRPVVREVPNEVHPRAE